MRETVLIVDDKEINRVILAESLKNYYELIQASSGKLALDILNTRKVDAVLLDLNMPGINGTDVLQAMNLQNIAKRVPILAITSMSDSNVLNHAYDLGAAEIIPKPIPNIPVLHRRIANVIELYSQRNALMSKLSSKDGELHTTKRRMQLQYDELSEKNAELLLMNNSLIERNNILMENANQVERIYSNLVEQIANLVEFRNEESGEHIKRVCGYSEIILHGLMEEFPEYNLTEDKIQKISFAAVLHDVGKIAINDNILCKPGALSQKEFETIKTHTVIGAQIINNMKDIMDEETFTYSKDIALHHHERFDGNGYPEGLVGDETPIWAQVVAVADVYDALSSQRIYKAAFEHDQSLAMILNGDCGEFNPKILKVLAKTQSQILDYSRKTA